jgi:hypothetical protein
MEPPPGIIAKVVSKACMHYIHGGLHVASGMERVAQRKKGQLQP